jgi:hypothetical protein
MTYYNCKKCNKIFNYIRGPILCYKCDEEVFNQIKIYLKENPDATTSNISQNLNIPIKIIEDYIKDRRLMNLRSVNDNLCPLCGNINNSNNKYCDKCMQKIKILNEINNLPNNVKEEVNSVPKMHYFDNERIKKR